MNIRKVVETHTSSVSKKSSNSEIREFDKKLEKLLLADENQNEPKKVYVEKQHWLYQSQQILIYQQLFY